MISAVHFSTRLCAFTSDWPLAPQFSRPLTAWVSALFPWVFNVAVELFEFFFFLVKFLHVCMHLVVVVLTLFFFFVIRRNGVRIWVIPLSCLTLVVVYWWGLHHTGLHLHTRLHHGHLRLFHHARVLHHMLLLHTWLHHWLSMNWLSHHLLLMHSRLLHHRLLHSWLHHHLRVSRHRLLKLGLTRHLLLHHGLSGLWLVSDGHDLPISCLLTHFYILFLYLLCHSVVSYF